MKKGKKRNLKKIYILAVTILLIILVAGALWMFVFKKSANKNYNFSENKEYQAAQESISRYKDATKDSLASSLKFQDEQTLEIKENGETEWVKNPNPKSEEEIKKEVEETIKRSIERWNEDKEENTKVALELIKKELKDTKNEYQIIDILSDREVIIQVVNPDTTELIGLYKVDIVREYVDKQF